MNIAANRADSAQLVRTNPNHIDTSPPSTSELSFAAKFKIGGLFVLGAACFAIGAAVAAGGIWLFGAGSALSIPFFIGGASLWAQAKNAHTTELANLRIKKMETRLATLTSFIALSSGKTANEIQTDVTLNDLDNLNDPEQDQFIDNT
jgi:hypothetical protein